MTGKPEGALLRMLVENNLNQFLQGFEINDADYLRFLDEVRRTHAEKDEAEQRALAVYMCLTHPGTKQAAVLVGEADQKGAAPAVARHLFMLHGPLQVELPVLEISGKLDLAPGHPLRMEHSGIPSTTMVSLERGTSRLFKWLLALLALLALLGAVHELRAQMVLEFQNAGSRLAVRSDGYVKIDCGTGVTCTFSASKYTITATNVWDITTYADATEITAPAAPAAGKERIYAKAGSGLCAKDSGGTERCTGGGGGGLGDPGANGVVVRTALNTTVARTITGTANEISVANGDGVAGNPTISLPAAITLTAKTLTNGTWTTPIISGYTVAGLPAAGTAGRVAVVTDASSAGSCTVGGGANIAFCRDSGAAWVPLGDGGGGGSGDITDVGDCTTGACFNALNTGTSLTFSNATSGTVTLKTVTGALGTVTLSLPAATDTLVGKATTDTFTNKSMSEAQITLTDITTGNVVSTKHGFAPKSPADALQFLNGAATPAYTFPLGYQINFAVETALAPADATTYFSGCSGGISTTAAIRKCFIAKAGTVKAINGGFTQTAGTAEASTIYFRLNNLTDTTISSTVTNDAASTTFNGGAMSIAVVAGDYFEIKWITPTWVTNPTAVRLQVGVYIE